MNLKAYRLKAGLTMEALAQKVGCHKQQVYGFESGRAIMPLKYAKKYSKFAGVPKEKLVNFLVKQNTERMLEKVGF